MNPNDINKRPDIGAVHYVPGNEPDPLSSRGELPNDAKKITPPEAVEPLSEEDTLKNVREALYELAQLDEKRILADGYEAVFVKVLIRAAEKLADEAYYREPRTDDMKAILDLCHKYTELGFEKRAVVSKLDCVYLEGDGPDELD